MLTTREEAAKAVSDSMDLGKSFGEAKSLTRAAVKLWQGDTNCILNDPDGAAQVYITCESTAM